MKIIYLVGLILLCSGFLFPTKVVPLPDVFNPDSIIVTDNEIYITSFPSIYIYSAKDFTLKKKIGKKGEGPQEFRHIAYLSVRPEYLFVGDRNKILYFSRDGNYLKEMNTKSIIYYDSALNKVKEISRYEFFYKTSGASGKCNAVEVRGIQFQVYDDKLFFKTGADLTFDVFDKSGTKTNTIKHDYQRILFPKPTKKGSRTISKPPPHGNKCMKLKLKKKSLFPTNYPPCNPSSSNVRRSAADWVREKNVGTTPRPLPCRGIDSLILCVVHFRRF